MGTSTENRSMLYLMSTTIIPAGAEGLWRVKSVSLDEARLIFESAEWANDLISAVGHASTAEVMSQLLEHPVEANRLNVFPQVGDEFLCFKLKQRPPEGAILDRAQLEELGYEWVSMRYIDAD
jgi:hypothetical protein